ncbi:hypothetical protein VNI00_001348 [Paramarasmius palmivorus]|uniref:Uncharacterized protein n=1 Tax=Paramarasmius palmivorus TaxID=297713 RepID=A0AAW0E6W1_9AGAR
MGVHLYDESPSGPIEQHTRLTPARALVQAGIPCVVWAEDALSFVHFVPTGLFTFQILVPDELLEHATDTITSTLPCYRRAPVPEGYQHWVELRIFNPLQPPCFPNAIPLVTSDNQNVPEHIIVHPASFWSFNMHDLSKTTALSPAYHSDDSTIRFPALHAFIDSMITTILEPPGGLHMRSKTLETRLRTFLGYLFTYTPAMRAEPPLLPDGSLEPGLKGVYEGIGEENRPYFMSLIRGPSDWAYHAAKRREILHKLE